MELREYWPELLAQLQEFQALAQAEQPEIGALLASVREAPDQFYIQTLPEAGAARWEGLLGLPVARGGSLEERRFRILTRAAEQRPFTLGRLRELMTTLCGPEGHSTVIRGEDATLVVRVALTAKGQYDEVGKLLDRMVPAALVVDLSLMYNQYLDLMGRRHSALSAYTHDKIKNEVIP